MIKKSKHGWNAFADYVTVHEKTLRLNESYMVVPKTYTIIKVTELYWTLEAIGIELRTFKGNRVRIDISKDVEVDLTNKYRPLARTEGYTYSANYPKGSACLIRYCSPHFDRDRSKAPDHHPFHHKHDFTSGKEVITKLSPDGFPHVSEFLVEVLKAF